MHCAARHGAAVSCAAVTCSFGPSGVIHMTSAVQLISYRVSVTGMPCGHRLGYVCDAPRRAAPRRVALHCRPVRPGTMGLGHRTRAGLHRTAPCSGFALPCRALSRAAVSRFTAPCGAWENMDISEHADANAGARRRRTPRTHVDLNVPTGASHRDLSDSTIRCGLAVGVRRLHAPKSC